MPLGPLGVTALLVALDWGAWDWATATNHGTVGLIAGLLMAPIAVGFAWSLARVVIALAQLGLRRASPQARLERVSGQRASVAPFDIEADRRQRRVAGRRARSLLPERPELLRAVAILSLVRGPGRTLAVAVVAAVAVAIPAFASSQHGAPKTAGTGAVPPGSSSIARRPRRAGIAATPGGRTDPGGWKVSRGTVAAASITSCATAATRARRACSPAAAPPTRVGSPGPPRGATGSRRPRRGRDRLHISAEPRLQRVARVLMLLLPGPSRDADGKRGGSTRPVDELPLVPWMPCPAVGASGRHRDTGCCCARRGAGRDAHRPAQPVRAERADRPRPSGSACRRAR